jgi:hypothetical protein
VAFHREAAGEQRAVVGLQGAVVSGGGLGVSSRAVLVDMRSLVYFHMCHFVYLAVRRVMCLNMCHIVNVAVRRVMRVSVRHVVYFIVRRVVRVAVAGSVLITVAVVGMRPLELLEPPAHHRQHRSQQQRGSQALHPPRVQSGHGRGGGVAIAPVRVELAQHAIWKLRMGGEEKAWSLQMGTVRGMER